MNNLLLLTMLLLSSCYIDDEGLHQIASAPIPEPVTTAAEVTKTITVEKTELVGAISENDEIHLTVSGIKKIPQFSEIHSDEVDCTWENAFSSSTGGYHPMKPIHGKCDVKRRDFNGYKEESIDFKLDMDSIRLRAKIGGTLYSLEETRLDSSSFDAVVVITNEMLQKGKSLELTVVPDNSAPKIETGIIEIDENASWKKNIKLDGWFAIPISISSAIVQVFNVTYFIRKGVNL